MIRQWPTLSETPLILNLRMKTVVSAKGTAPPFVINNVLQDTFCRLGSQQSSIREYATDLTAVYINGGIFHLLGKYAQLESSSPINLKKIECPAMIAARTEG